MWEVLWLNCVKFISFSIIQELVQMLLREEVYIVSGVCFLPLNGGSRIFSREVNSV